MNEKNELQEIETLLRQALSELQEQGRLLREVSEHIRHRPRPSPQSAWSDVQPTWAGGWRSICVSGVRSWSGRPAVERRHVLATIGLSDYKTRDYLTTGGQRNGR